MGYKDKRYGITEIRPQDDKVDCLSVSWDYRDDEKDKAQREAVFLYTPHMEDVDSHGCPHHYHVHLNQEQARALRDWLNDFIEDVECQD